MSLGVLSGVALVTWIAVILALPPTQLAPTSANTAIHRGNVAEVDTRDSLDALAGLLQQAMPISGDRLDKRKSSV